MTDPILFHHKNSQACQKLLQLIPKDSKIQYVDIGTLQKIPSSVKSVPCLIVDGSNVYLGKDAFNYFSSHNELEFVNLCGKNGSKCVFSTLDDDSIESNGLFSSLTENDMAKGVPKYDEEKQGTQLDVDKLTALRAEEFNSIKRE